MHAQDNLLASDFSPLPMRILTDFPRFPKQWRIAERIEGETRTTLVRASLKTFWNLFLDIRRSDVIVVQQSLTKVFWLSVLFTIMPFLRKPIVLVDVVLRKPRRFFEHAQSWVEKTVLKQVDHFIHYFRELDGYQTIYGITPDRSSYVPFKANLYGEPSASQILSHEKEEYVFAAGWSLRDYDTFFEAISRLDCPAAIPRPSMQRLQEHGARFTRPLQELPPEPGHIG